MDCLAQFFARYKELTLPNAPLSSSNVLRPSSAARIASQARAARAWGPEGCVEEDEGGAGAGADARDAPGPNSSARSSISTRVARRAAKWSCTAFESLCK